MHDPLVVAFEIHAPWLRRAIPVMKGVRWRWGRYVVLAGRWYRWSSLITVWHREPGGHDSGSVCKLHEHRPDTGWRFYWGWRFHVHHWRVQVHPWQRFRRWAFTRCAWCGGRSSKGDPVNVSHQWHGPRGPWWRGEPGLFHSDCSSVEHAHRMCLCTAPVLEHGTYGRCLVCDKQRAHGAEIDDAHRALAALPDGGRITPEVRAFLEPLWAERRARRGQPEPAPIPADGDDPEPAMDLG